MSWREYLRVALRALRAHKFRSLLTVSSITLGAFSIVFMSSLAQSGLTTLVRDIEELGGARLLLVAPKAPERTPGKAGSSPGHITTRDRDALFDALPHTVGKSLYATMERTDVTNDSGENARTDFVAADAGFFKVLNLEIEKGRTFTEEENRQRAKVCTVGYDLAKNLWAGDAVGRWLTVSGQRCQVIGQLKKIDHWDMNFGFEWLNFVTMPFETAVELRPEVRNEAFIEILTDDLKHNDIVKRIANAIMVDRHHGVDDFQIWDFGRFMKKFYLIFAVMEAIVGLVAGIALVVGGIGVMNMMLVSVSERTREVGIRKALGASPNAIASQFLWEATMLSGIGGLLGTVAGAGAAIGAGVLIQKMKELWITEVSVIAVVVALASSLIIGISFGFFPARAASKLDPVAAMRR